MNDNMDNKNNGNKLSKVLGRTDIIAIGFGTMVGWSWIMMTTSWVNEAGILGAVIAFLIGGAIILAIGLVYGELTAALPLAGGEFAFIYRAMGRNSAWLVGWIMTLAYMGVAAWEGIALATAIDYILPIPKFGPLMEIAGYQVYLSWALVGVAGALIITLLNLIGVKSALLFQVMATAALIIIAIVIFLGGVTFGDIDNMGRPFESGRGFFYVLLMVPAMLIGFDIIPQSAEEMNIGPKNIGKMIVVCIIISLLWYLIMIIGVGLAAPAEIRFSGIIPMTDVAAYLFSSQAFSTIIVFGGILGILTTWNGFFIGATRLIYAMGRAWVIPPVFGSVHRKYKTPWAATLLVGLVCVIAPFFGQNALIWFINTSSLSALISYCFVIMAFLILRKKDAGLDRPFRIKGGMVFGRITFAVSIMYLIAYISSEVIAGGNAPEFIIIAAWVVVGAALAAAAKFKDGHISAEEREILIFGERLARRGDGQ